MDLSKDPRRGSPDGEWRTRVEDLLRRYPDVSESEAAEILRFLTKGPVLGVGLMTASEQLQPQLARFRQDHASAFSLGVRDYLIVVVAIAALVVACLLLWDAGVG